MAEAVAAMAVIKAVQIPLTLLTSLQLTGILWPEEPILKNNSCFDYIIIGGGTAGMVLASRLSEDKNKTVLVAEAGGNPPIEALLPLLFVTQPLSPADWNFTSTYNSTNANAQTNNVTKLTSGKMLGGSSCMDHFIHVRAAPFTFDEWADIVDDPSWDYENVPPYFIKSEKLNDSTIEKSAYEVYHGLDGPMGVAREPTFSANPYLVSFGEAGNPIKLDVNGPDAIGYTQSMYIVTDGIRQCSAWSYIHPVKDRKNLYVLRHAYVTRIIFGKNKRAKAIVVYKNNMFYVFRASREIILCAGVYKTPQILMLSGIGPKKHLESFNIDVIVDLPVGETWCDQESVVMVHRTDNSVVDPVVPLPTIIPFPVLVGLAAVDKKQKYADYQVFGIIIGQGTPYLILACYTVFGYRAELCDFFNNEVIISNSLFSLITNVNPTCKCSGHVKLNTSDPFDDPSIKTGYYEKVSDLDKMASYIEDYLDVEKSTFFSGLNSTFLNPDYPACRNYTFRSHDFFKCYALHSTGSVYHSSSSCPMGSVVDSNLRVYGVKGLRVVDASVMPTVPRGSPHAIVVMIAEKASDMIKADADKYYSCADLKRKCRYTNIYPVEEYQNKTATDLIEDI